MGRFELESLTEYTDEAILEEIRRVAQRLGDGPFTLTAFERLSPRVSAGTIQRRFGNWKAAIQKAGLEHLSQERFPTPYQERLARGRAMSDDDLIAEMSRVHQLTGREVLTKDDFNRLSVTRYEIVWKRFGGWHKALERAGIGKSEAGKRYSEDECFMNLAALWNHYGRQPRYHELTQPPSAVGPKAYVRWGNWRRALAAFVEWANTDYAGSTEASSKESTEEADPVLPPKVRSSAEDRHEVPPRLKWQVHVRDGFRCVACGKNPPQHGVTLHADHIEPWADGGKTILENLQTLCEPCNLGKGRSYGKAI
jgi:hypothetical protein